jgi:hypothetical protein
MIDDEKRWKVVGKYKISASVIAGVSFWFAERECTASFHAAYW